TQRNVIVLAVKQLASAPLQSPAAEPVASPLRIAGARNPSYLLPPQNGTDSGEHFARVERLDEVIVSTELEPDNAVDLIGAVPRHDDHRHLRVRPDVAKKIKAIVLAKPQIEHDQAGIDAFKIAVQLRPARGGLGGYTMLFKEPRQHLAQR